MHIISVYVYICNIRKMIAIILLFCYFGILIGQFYSNLYRLAINFKHNPMLDSIQIEVSADPKHVSFQTEQSAITGSSRKKYYLKKSSLATINHKTNISLRSSSNIFDLTSGVNRSCSEITDNNLNFNSNGTATQSRLYTNSLFSSPSKDTLMQNPQKKIVLPIITESKYNFRPIITLPKVKKRQVHEKAPLYVQQAAKIDEHNIRKMKKYQKMWAQSSQLRQDKSLLQKSVQKSDKYILKHNYQFLQKKASIEFETILRDRHKKQENRIGFGKGVPNRSLPGLKGKGGSVRSLFQEMYAVEEVYKIDK